MPRLLDLFCGQGGAGMGYSRAGFDVVGVDIVPQPRYPFPFIQTDTLEVLGGGAYWKATDGNYYGLNDFEAIHASPPCQAFTDLKHMYNAKEHPDLLWPTRSALIALGKPYVIENVEGAPMFNYITLCGTALGLGTDTAELRRHRRFEIVPHLLMVPPCAHRTKAAVIGVYGGHGRDRRRTTNTQHFTTAERAEAMGIDWMTGDGLRQAIPPAYTQYIGCHLLAALAEKDK